MNKKELLTDVYNVLADKNGEYGRCDLESELLRVPECVIKKYHIAPSWDGTHIAEVFHADTPSMMAVRTLNGHVFDFAEMNFNSVRLVHRAILLKRVSPKIRQL